MSNVIVFRGPIGAGKTTLMNRVAQGVPECSAIEVDKLKQMADRTASSEWRREVALQTAVFMGRTLLARGRSFATELHSRWEEHAYEFLKLADCFEGVKLHRVLVTAPYETCVARVEQRVVPDVDYDIDRQMVDKYYTNLRPLPGELVVDTSLVDPLNAAQLVIDAITNSDLERSA